MKRWQTLLLVYLALQASVLMAQQPDTCAQCSKYLYWTGEVNQDFFNEQNWREAAQLRSAPNPPAGPGTTKPYCLAGANKKNYQICLNVPDLAKDKHPAQGTLDPGVEIRCNLYASEAEIDAKGTISFAADQIGFTLNKVKLNVTGTLAKGILSIDGGSTVQFRSANALAANASVNFLDAESWIYFQQDNPDNLLASASRLWVKDAPGTVDQNLRINQYYQHGAIVRKRDLTYSPLSIYSSASLVGASAVLGESTTYAGNSIPAGMNNQIRSFVLKRGYMVTFAVKENGTGKSKVYIASEGDLRVDDLPLALQGNVSFIRVLPWNWVSKKGTGGLITGLDAAWFYNWGNGENSKPNNEYVPMVWGAGAALPAPLNLVIQKEKVTHLLGFNESDNCNGQSGQFNNLCQPEVAVTYYENLMRTGMRLGTPAPRENGPTTWLKEFARLAKERDVRFDFVAVHWYDWGASPQNSPNANPAQVFNRFKAYLANVYQIYGLPIWITEFNANPNRENSVQDEFLRLALPYLEQLDYVERYAYFQPDPRNASNPVTPANYFDANGKITNIGIIYRDQVSTPSIPEASLAAPNNLQGMDEVYVEGPAPSLGFEAENAVLLGTAAVVACPQSSNGQQVNMGASIDNGIRFDNVVVPSAGAYSLTISYMSASVLRNCRLLVNGVDLGILAMSKSGEWCFNGGAPGAFKHAIQLNAGVNKIEFKAAGTEAPFIDKILLVQSLVLTSVLNAPEQENQVHLSVYPNPSAAQDEFSILVDALHGTRFEVQVVDVLGRAVFGNAAGIVGKPLKSGRSLSPGVYFIVVNVNATKHIQKLIVR